VEELRTGKWWNGRSTATIRPQQTSGEAFEEEAERFPARVLRDRARTAVDVRPVRR